MTDFRYTVLRCLILAVFLMLSPKVSSQLVINEASGRNDTQVFDEDGESKDWIELYNSSDQAIDLNGWTLSDDKALPEKWTFPAISLEANDFLLVWASGKGSAVSSSIEKWESAVLPNSEFRYTIPDITTPADWNTLAYDDQAWETGQAGFGYGDDDDSTLVPEGTSAIYIRTSFIIPDTNVIRNAICHIDYDDGFIAYLNGIEICRSNINGDPSWNSLASNQHDAVLFEGGTPEGFYIDIDLLSAIWIQGENVFAVEVHNISEESSDLSLIPYLSFSISGENSYFSSPPLWLAGSFTQNIHTNFKINTKGETIYLFNDIGEFIDSLYVARTPVDYSIGRETDGAENIAVFKQATPNRTNNTTAYINGYEPSPIIYPESGFFDDSILVSISSTSKTVVIRYTTDGSEPTLSSTIYDGEPFYINKSSVVNAKCYSTESKKLNSIPGRKSYFIGEEYTLPVLSVFTDNSNLYGSAGIFTNWSQSWNKPCYIEYFDANNKLAFTQDAGIQIDGGAGGSRSHAQHSFRIEPDHGTYGAGSVNYNLIPDRPERDSYASFYMRNGSNQYLILPYKDGLEVKGMGKNTYNYYSAYTPVAVHLNGGFFGIYEMREKLNADYLVNNYGMDVDSIELLGVSYFKGMWLQPQIGTIDNYMADYEYFLTLDPESPGYIEDIASFLDLDNYTDYIIGESWIANTDWPQNNIKIFRCASTDYKWRFMLVDLEWALRPNEWSNSNTDHIAYMNSRAEENLYIIFWYRMMQTEEYRNRFINRFADLMNTNYHFDNLGIMEQEIYDEILPEMPKEYERWGGSNIELQMENFTKNHTTFRSELRNRSSRVRSHLKYHYDLDDHIYIDLDVSPPEAGRIKISTITPSEYPWRGTYFTDVPLAFEAIPNPGYIFNGWGESEYISDPDNPEFTSLITSKYNDITANFLSGSIEYDGITISEINYKDGSDFLSTDWFELHNSTDEDLDLEGWYFTDSDSTHIYTFGSGTLISSNDYLVIAKDLQIFSYKYPEVNNYTGGFLFDLSDHSDQINLYNPEGELMLSLKYSNHYPWPLSNLIDGSTLELLDPNKDLNDPENWIAGCIGGSPGKAYEKCNPNLSLDENKVIPAGGEIQNLLLYPNPIKDIFTLEFYAENSLSILELKLYDIYGRIVNMKSLENLSSGSHSITFENIESLKPQVYYMVLTTNKSRESIKIVVQ